jgi:hypothetical protein
MATHWSRMKQAWKQTTIGNKLIIILTFTIALSNLFYVRYARKQWQVMSNQLAEMHSSSVDTHELAVAAGKQAVAANTQSQQAIAQTNKMTASLAKTDDLIRQTTDQAKATNRLAAEAERQAVASEGANAQTADLFRIQNRPWVGLYGPITLSKATENPHRIEITTRIKNFGSLPASNVDPDVRFILGNRGTDIRPEIEKVCTSLESNILPLKVGDILFPGDSFSFPTEVNSILDEGQADPIYFFPGCIIYIDTNKKVHRTKVCQWTDREHLKVGAGLSSCSRQFAD